MNRNKKGEFIKGHKNLHLKRIGLCKVEGCGKNLLTHNFCSKHYQRYKKYGNPIEPYHWLGRPKSGKNFLCETCQKTFYRSPSEIIKSKPRYCSRFCAFKGMKGQLKNLKPIEESKWYINRKGYLQTTRRRKRILQHRWIVETRIIKRPLKYGEIIHHLNGIKIDNRKENLSICRNHTHHLFIKKLRERIKELENRIKC